MLEDRKKVFQGLKRIEKCLIFGRIISGADDVLAELLRMRSGDGSQLSIDHTFVSVQRAASSELEKVQVLF